MTGKAQFKPRPDYEHRASFQPRTQQHLGYMLLVVLTTWLLLISITHHWLNGDGVQRTTISIIKKTPARNPASPVVKCVSQAAGGGNICGE